MRGFAAAHLDALIAEREAEGEVVAARLTAAAEAVLAAHAEREAIGHQIGELCHIAGSRVRPGDIAMSAAQDLAGEAAKLIRAGGETFPKLRRDPREPIHAVVESVPAA